MGGPSAAELFAQELEHRRPEDAAPDWDWPPLLFMYVGAEGTCQFAAVDPPADTDEQGALLTEELPAYLAENAPILTFALALNGHTPDGEEVLSLIVAASQDIEMWETEIVRGSGPPSLNPWRGASIAKDAGSRGIYAEMMFRYWQTAWPGASTAGET